MRPTPFSGRERIDLGVYPQALFLALRNPVIFLGPLLAAVLAAAVGSLFGEGGDSFGLVSLVARTLDAFGLALATLVADMVWRRGRTSFDEAWEQTRLKAGDIVFASLGFSMVVYVAAYVGGIFGDTGALLCSVIAGGTFLYSIAACTIGGVPGGLSLQASLDLTKSRPLNTALMTIVFGIIYYGAISIPVHFLGTVNASMIIVAVAVCRSIAIGYAATVLAKRYTDISFANR
jgi:hypothetical protein